MKLVFDPGTEQWVPWARRRLAALTALRRDLRLPYLKKVWVPDSGVMVYVQSGENHADFIRITGGWAGMTVYTDPLSPSTPPAFALAPVGTTASPAKPIRYPKYVIAVQPYTSPPTALQTVYYQSGGIPGSYLYGESGTWDVTNAQAYTPTTSLTPSGGSSVQVFNTKLSTGSYQLAQLFQASFPEAWTANLVSYDGKAFSERTDSISSPNAVAAPIGVCTVNTSQQPSYDATNMYTFTNVFGSGLDYTIYFPTFTRAESTLLGTMAEVMHYAVTQTYATTVSLGPTYADYTSATVVGAYGAVATIDVEEKTWFYTYDPSSGTVTDDSVETRSYTLYGVLVYVVGGAVSMVRPDAAGYRLSSPPPGGIIWGAGTSLSASDNVGLSSGALAAQPQVIALQSGADQYELECENSYGAATAVTGPTYYDSTLVAHTMRGLGAASWTCTGTLRKNGTAVWTGALYSLGGGDSPSGNEVYLGWIGNVGATGALSFVVPNTPGVQAYVWDGAAMTASPAPAGLSGSDFSFCADTTDSSYAYGWLNGPLTYVAPDGTALSVPLDSGEQLVSGAKTGGKFYTRTSSGGWTYTVSQDPSTGVWGYSRAAMAVQTSWTTPDGRSLTKYSDYEEFKVLFDPYELANIV